MSVWVLVLVPVFSLRRCRNEGSGNLARSLVLWPLVHQYGSWPCLTGLPRTAINDVGALVQWGELVMSEIIMREVNRRAVLRGAGALGVAQVASPFLIQARGETPVNIGFVDP